MPLIDPDHPLAPVLSRDRRYALDAYVFVLESLAVAQDVLGMGEPAVRKSRSGAATTGGGTRSRRRSDRHISGQELCEAARQYAIQQYGYLARTVLAAWGVSRTDDFGEIVFNMIDIGQMRKTSKDRREDFHGVYDFAEGFERDLAFVVPDQS